MCKSDIGKTLTEKYNIFKLVRYDSHFYPKSLLDISICFTFNRRKMVIGKKSYIFKCFGIL